jgi:hypothetical protein
MGQCLDSHGQKSRTCPTRRVEGGTYKWDNLRDPSQSSRNVRDGTGGRLLLGALSN